jgi:hypothetical protein
MTKCPFLEKLKCFTTNRECDSEACTLDDIPPLSHLLAAGALVAVLAVLVGWLVTKSRR